MKLFAISIQLGDACPRRDKTERNYHVQCADRTSVFSWLQRQLLLYLKLASTSSKARAECDSPTKIVAQDSSNAEDILLPALFLQEVFNWIRYDHVQQVKKQRKGKPYTMEEITLLATTPAQLKPLRFAPELQEYAQELLCHQVDLQFIQNMTAKDMEQALGWSMPGHFYAGDRNDLNYVLWDKHESFAIHVDEVVVIHTELSPEQKR